MSLQLSRSKDQAFSVSLGKFFIKTYCFLASFVCKVKVAVRIPIAGILANAFFANSIGLSQ